MDQVPSDPIDAIALLDEPVRRRAYDWVSAQAGPVGRDQVAYALGITRALAAFHLDRLARVGLLATEYRRLTGRVGPGAGRPAKLYRRAARQIELSLPPRRYELAARLLAQGVERLTGAQPPRELLAAAHERGERLGVAHRVDDGGPPQTRASRLLGELGYEPRMEDPPAMRLGNCPFDALVADHRSLMCSLNLAFVRGVLTGLGLDAARATLDPQQGACCVAIAAGAPAEDGGGAAAGRLD